MRRRKPIYYLVKTCRASGYALFSVMLVFILTGFALCGQYGVEQWISSRNALYLHQLFDGPLIALFLVHALGASYLGMRRWGWVKR
jgi:cytochrome b subunit of formate dehydrogenase